MASHDFSSIKFPPKIDGLNFLTWKENMTLFLMSLGLQRPSLRSLYNLTVMRIHGPKPQPKTVRLMLRHTMHSHKH